MSDLIKVEGNANLRRDPHTNSIINTDKSGYDQYIARRNKKKEEKQKSLQMEEEVANMKKDLDEIKTLLRRLTNGS